MLDGLKSWRSSLAIIPFIAIAWCLHDRVITNEQAILLLSATGVYLSSVTQDGQTK